MALPTILEIVPGSPADKAGLAIGDELVSVNGVVPSDVIEYQQLIDDADAGLVIRRSGLEREMLIGNDEGEPLGLRLDSSIFDRVQTCDNHCEFCFIYQLPSGMRRSLYLKDDDYRLSFLYGNFTTLTRFTEADLARVVDEGLGPLYVSIHSTDPLVRAEMLRNRRGGTSLRWLRALLDNGVVVHGQIVLCPGRNNARALDLTCAEIVTRYPGLASVGVVPLGLSRHNDETSLIPHDPATARADLDIVHRWQAEARRRLGRRMFFAADELYLVAGRPMPASDAYEEFDQHENGIGMARSLYDELELMERGTDPAVPQRTGEWRTLPAAPAEGYRTDRAIGGASFSTGSAVVVTGKYGAVVLGPVRPRLERLAGRPIRILEVANRFFGGNVGVAGLLVGEDIRDAIEADDGGAGVYLLPDVALSGRRFLDEMTVDDVACSTATPIRVAPATAAGLVQGAAA